ncbi:Hypothetical protein R9X50_00431700 [Acrodontium crateriforme]|uniref:Peptidase A1 domain-containing protein n=1 Tax=Acrodontium crateriforme TaxID=150365 RepID=A0AAQ3RA42_9PEZI|nr:Hypothetical protein R9X50_00431700 [Acrodontium crateriforme]
MPLSLARMLLLPTALLASNLPAVLALSLFPTRDATSTTLPAPLSIHPDENWDGVDGQWSSFTLRVGTPQQFVRVFMSFNGYQTWVVLPQGCTGAADQNACEALRGGIFNTSASSTWDTIGLYDLSVDRNLGFVSNAYYSYETVGLSGLGENGPTIQNTTVGAMAGITFYLGLFGLNPKPSNFTGYNDPSPSYMTLLKEQKQIASLSVGYTAGANYRYTGVPASLTLGGYDANKFTANDVEFIFAPDNERTLIVGVQSISTPSSNLASPVGIDLLPNPIYAMIDSTIAEMWLPQEACSVFESQFGLVWDNNTELYLVNQTLHDSLTKRNASITFQLGQGTSGGPTIQIELPYAAFDLTAQAPYQGLSNQSYYFPIRRAANDSQYTIGRTFLQEAYLTVDWESQRFNISQVVWSQNASEHLVVIPPSTGESTGTSGANSTSDKSEKITAGAIAGIVVGAVVLIAIVLGLVMWHFHRQNKAAKAREKEKLGLGYGEGNNTVLPKAELEGSSPYGGPGSRRDFRGVDSRNLLSAGGSTAVGSSDLESPLSPVAGGGLGYFGRNRSPHSLSTPSAGEGTHSSSDSAPFSPLAPSSNSEVENRALFIHEMPADMPAIREKDGRPLTEKEALAHRERVYNGVNSNPVSATSDSNSPRAPPRRINPDEIIRAPREIQQRLRAQDNFGHPSPHAQDPFAAGHQPAGCDHGPFSDVGIAQTTSTLQTTGISPIATSTGESEPASGRRGLHRAFSFEEHDNNSSEELYK